MIRKRRLDIDAILRSREGEEGFGVIEVTIVIAIISIFAGVGIPAFNCVRRRAISQAAQTTIQQIKDECESNYVYGNDNSTATSPSQYQITSIKNNSCSAGTISLVPTDTTKYPTYLYKFNESELSYNFKGQTGTSFVACNKLICGESDSNSLTNESILFASDSGLSCREVISNNLGRLDFGIGWMGSGVKNDGDTVELTLQPATISIGNKSWLIDDVQTTLTFYNSHLDLHPYLESRKWQAPFIQKAVEVINASKGEFSAEVDPSNPSTMNIYSSTGTKVEAIHMSVDTTVDGKGITPLHYVPWNKKKPYAMVSLSSWGGDGGGRRTNLSSVYNQEKNGSVIDQKLTTVCDGRD